MARLILLAILSSLLPSEASARIQLIIYAKPPSPTKNPHAWIRIINTDATPSTDQSFDFNGIGSGRDDLHLMLLGIPGQAGPMVGTYYGSERLSVETDLTPQQFDAVNALIATWNADPPAYAYLVTNCISFAQAVAKAAGLQVPTTIGRDPVQWTAALEDANLGRVRVAGSIPAPADAKLAIAREAAADEQTLTAELRTLYVKFERAFSERATDHVASFYVSRQNYIAKLNQDALRASGTADFQRNRSIWANAAAQAAAEQEAAAAFTNELMGGYSQSAPYYGGISVGNGSAAGIDTCAVYNCLQYDYKPPRTPIVMPMKKEVGVLLTPAGVIETEKRADASDASDASIMSEVEPNSPMVNAANAVMFTLQPVIMINDQANDVSNEPLAYYGLGERLAGQTVHLKINVQNVRPLCGRSCDVQFQVGGDLHFTDPADAGSRNLSERLEPSTIGTSLDLTFDAPDDKFAYPYLDVLVNGIRTNRIYFLYGPHKEATLTFNRSTALLSGDGKSWSGWYQLSSGLFPVGYTVKSIDDVEVSITGAPRDCTHWARCSKGFAEGLGALAQFSVQGHEGNLFKQDKTVTVTGTIIIHFSYDEKQIGEAGFIRSYYSAMPDPTILFNK